MLLMGCRAFPPHEVISVVASSGAVASSGQCVRACSRWDRRGVGVNFLFDVTLSYYLAYPAIMETTCFRSQSQVKPPCASNGMMPGLAKALPGVDSPHSERSCPHAK